MDFSHESINQNQLNFLKTLIYLYIIYLLLYKKIYDSKFDNIYINNKCHYFSELICNSTSSRQKSLTLNSFEMCRRILQDLANKPPTFELRRTSHSLSFYIGYVQLLQNMHVSLP